MPYDKNLLTLLIRFVMTAPFRYCALIIFNTYIFFLPQTAHAATVSLNPASAIIELDQTIDIAVLLDTEEAQTSSTDVILTYDPSSLNLIEILPGTLYDQYLGDSINNTAGRASISGIAYSPSTLYDGVGIFATFRFQGINTGITSVNFDYTPKNSNDTNVNIINIFTDSLESVQNGSYTISAKATTAIHNPQQPLPSPTTPIVSTPITIATVPTTSYHPTTTTKPSCGTIMKQARALQDSLSPGQEGFHGRLNPPVSDCEYNSGSYSKGYLSTFFIIDAYNLAGYSELAKHTTAHIEGATLRNWWKSAPSGYQFIPYSPSVLRHFASNRLDLAGCVMFLSMPSGIFPALINRLEQYTSDGNGVISVLHAGARFTQDRFIVSNWAILNTPMHESVNSGISGFGCRQNL